MFFQLHALRCIVQNKKILPTFSRAASSILILGSICLFGCGGGGGGGVASGGGIPVDGGGNGGVGGTGVVAQGSISGFGSVIVNGTEFETPGSTKVTINGNTNATPADLKLGMVVDIEAYRFTPTLRTEAEHITYHNNVRGPIESIATNCAAMVVMGQTIQVDATARPTLQRGACDFAVGTYVEISGLLVGAQKNIIRATLVDAVAVAGSLQVMGLISNVDSQTKTFVIGALSVDYGGASVTPLGASVSSGANVIVTGMSLSDNKLVASSIKVIKPGLSAVAGTEAELEGFIVDLAGKKFTLSGQSVDASTAILEPSGVMLTEGARVEVEGNLDALGVVIAKKVEVKPDAPLMLESNVEAKSATTLTLLGLTISVVASTEFEDESSAQARSFKLIAVQLGDHLAVSCYRNQSGQLIATKIKRLNPSLKVIIQGPIGATDSSHDSFSLFYGNSIEVIISRNKTEIKDKNDAVLNAGDFFKITKNGDLVRAEGKLGSLIGILDATDGKVEIKNSVYSSGARSGDGYGSGTGSGPGSEDDKKSTDHKVDKEKTD